MGEGATEFDDFLTMAPRQIKAEYALVNGDVEPRMAMWFCNDLVTLFGAWRPCKTGWDDVSRTFRWVASRFSNGSDYNVELVAVGVSEDLAYTVGYEREAVSVDGSPTEPNKLRVMHVYRRENGEWKIVYCHSDHPHLPCQRDAQRPNREIVTAQPDEWQPGHGRHDTGARAAQLDRHAKRHRSVDEEETRGACAHAHEQAVAEGNLVEVPADQVPGVRQVDGGKERKREHDASSNVVLLIQPIVPPRSLFSDRGRGAVPRSPAGVASCSLCRCDA